MSLVRPSSEGGPVGIGGGKGSGRLAAMLGIGVAAGSIPAFRNMFMRAMGSGVADAAGTCGSTRGGGGDLIATVAGGG